MDETNYTPLLNRRNNCGSPFTQMTSPLSSPGAYTSLQFRQAYVAPANHSSFFSAFWQLFSRHFGCYPLEYTRHPYNNKETLHDAERQQISSLLSDILLDLFTIKMQTSKSKI